MEGIEFEKEVYTRPVFIQQKPKTSWAVRLVMKLSGGLIKTEEQAQLVLMIVAIVLFLLSIYNFFF